MTHTRLKQTQSMSSRRQLVMAAIRQYFRETGASPSLLEIGNRVGLDARHVGPHLKRLQKDGLLSFEQHVGRSIRLTDRTANLSDEEIEWAVHSRGWQLTKSALPPLAQAIPLENGILADAAALLSQLDNMP